ncbi:MAG: acyl carrier protein [Ruminococcaceae bacterium]|nr:acyl carrier protein [Oscillospiraceae bacterium]
MREQLLAILKDIKPEVDFETATTLIDDNILDSFDIVTVVVELNDAFDIEVSVDDLVPENLNSVDAMIELINSLQNGL